MWATKSFDKCCAISFLTKYKFYTQRQHKHRNGSNFQRPRLSPLTNDRMRTLRTDFLKNCSTEMSNEKWLQAREGLLTAYKHINLNNVDATILGLLNEGDTLQLAKNYISFMRAKGIEPNLATLGRFLRVYNTAYQQKGALTEAEEEEISKICDKMRVGHDILDAITCEHLIHGLVTTKNRWKEALDLLEMAKLTAIPGTSAYNQLILKSFSTHEIEIGWRLLEEMVLQSKQPKCELYCYLLDMITKENHKSATDFHRLLRFLEKFGLTLTRKVADAIIEMAKFSKIEYHANITRINGLGKCANCGKYLKSVAINEDEYNKLNESFLQKVLIRSDIFQKSTPEEVEHFKRFVDETAPYDCVIDGLNVAYSKGAKRAPKDLAALLAAVVRYFENKGKSVLVLGRQHMSKWPKDIMKYVRQHANVYLTNNLSHDDPFMLFATLKSGQSTDFFSRDLMRTHAHLLGPELKPIFRRWQQEHQFSLVTHTNTGKIIVKEPIRYLLTAHQVDDNWHLPVIPEYVPHLPETFEAPESWLCLNLKQRNM